ncbi:uncharacterized protein LOC112524202 isoform X2 [Cynara cardunculus var. scolymus]|uniref:uncharacterized protein LOC112524202 isoform X2 n=1 Tax=Cynara cardunculus var. scolymus TaxID=59895 RepID=UPI000D625E24|nr:uncharacterized protein LOC112524202 isoform X2 [Cynara cardunculus var. scolymus]
MDLLPSGLASNNQSVVRNFLQLPKEVRDGVGKIKNNWIIVHVIVSFKLIRMEDPESEWAIQEYPSWNEEGDMLKWILKKGYGIGKKMVITGIIVSSAPLVLPPLVVFSAMGVAFSVPFGLVFASYACTNKLMRKLLPTPEIELPLMRDEEQSEDIKQGYECLDDYRQIEGGLVTIMGGIVDKKGYYTDEDDDLKRQNLMQQEDEQERIRYIEERAEIRFELDDDGYHKKVEALMTNVDENVVEDDQAYDRIKDVELDDGGDDDYRQFLQGKSIVIQQGVEMRLGDERVQGSRSNIKVGGNSADEQGYEEDAGEYLEGDDDDSLEEERKEAMEDETEEIVKGSTGLLEKIRDEGRRNIDNESTTDPVRVKEIDSEKKLVEEASKNEEPGGEIRQEVVLAGRNEENNFNAREVERQPVGDATKKKNMGLQEKNSSIPENEHAILRTKEEQLIHANADAREIGGESGLDLFGTSMNSGSLEAGDEVDAMALPNSFRRPTLDSDYVKVASTTDTKVPSREDNLDEEKIWEKISTMRAIVGYKAPSEATYMGELKALYVFTGIEPPASFKGDSDLDEVNANLKFLMSIVGVK